MKKIGVCEWCLPVWGPDSIYFAADVGFEGVQLTDLGGSGKGYPMTNQRIREGYVEAAQKTGVVLHSMHLHSLPRVGGMIYPLDSPKGQSTLLSIRNGIDSCEAMGIPCLNISAFFQSNVNNNYDWNNLVDHLDYACRYGKDHGVYVAYEPGVPAAKIREILERLPDLTINYDLTNPRSLGVGEPLEELAELEIAALDHIHVKDSRRNAFGKYLGSCFAGEGSGRIREAIHLLKERGYDKWYLSESNYIQPLPYGVGPDISTVCRKDCEAIRELVKNA